MDEPVFIDIEMRQNIGEESKKAESSLSALAEKSLQTREAVKQSLERQAEVVRIAAQNVKEVEKALAGATDSNSARELKSALQTVNDELVIEQKELRKLQQESERLGRTNSVMQQRMNGVRAEMQELDLAGKRNSERYRELRSELERLAKAQRLVEEEQSKLGRGRSFDGLVEGVQGLTAAFAATYGAMALVTGSSEEYEEIQSKLEGTMALVVGMQQLQATLASTSAFRIQVVSRATQLWTAANTRLASALGISTVAAKGLMIALTGGLTIAITFAIAALDRLISKRRAAREQDQAIAKATASSVGEQIAAYKKLQIEWEKVKAGQKSVNEFIKEGREGFEKLGTSVKSSADAERVMTADTENFVKALQLRAMAAAKMSVAADLYKEGVEKMIQADDEAKDIGFLDILGSAMSGLNNPAGRISAEELSESRAEDTRKEGQSKIDKANALIQSSSEDEERWKEIFKNLNITIDEGGRNITNSVKKYAGELERISADLQKEITSTIVAGLEEGAQKELATLNAKHEERKSKMAEYARKIEAIEKKFGIDGSKQREQLHHLEIEEEKQYAAEVAALKKSSHDAISTVMAELDAKMLNSEQKRFNDLNSEFDEAIKVVKEKGLSTEEQLAAIGTITIKRMTAQARLRKQIELEHLDWEEQVANRRAEIYANSGSFIFDTDREEYVLRTQAEYVAKRIAKLEELAIAGEDVAKALEDARVEQERLNAEIDKIPVKRVKEIGGAVKSVFSSIASLGGEIGDIFGALSSGVDGVLSALDKSASAPQQIAGAVSGITSLVSIALNQAKENARVEQELAAHLEDAYHRAAVARIQALEYKPGNIYGVENPYAKVISGAQQYKAVMTELGATLHKLEGGQVQTGTKRVFSGKNIAGGAAAGATVGAAAGSFIPVIGNVLGAAIGGVLGGIFGAMQKKVVPVFESLSKKFGSILKDGTKTFELNPKIIENYESLDGATKKIVDNWEEIRKKSIEAEKQMQESFKALTGDLGGLLSRALSDGFRSGDIDAALADFDQKVNDTIISIMEQQLFAQFFKKDFEELQKGMEESFNPGGDGDIKDNILKFKKGYKAKLEAYKEARQAYMDGLKEMGVTQEKMDEDGRKSVARRGLAQASQDSIDELMGIETNILQHVRLLAEYTKGERSTRSATLVIIQAIARNVQVIADNSAFLRKLEGIARDIEKLNRDGITLRQ